MFAVTAARLSPEDPLSALELGERPEPEVPSGWTTVTVKATSLNHHDLWSLRGVGLTADRLPMILGCDAAGIDEDGNEVVVHAVISDPDWSGDETLDPRRSLLSERYQGALAERGAARPAADGVGTRAEALVRQRLPGGEGLDPSSGDEAAQLLGHLVGVPLARGDNKHRHTGARLRGRERGRDQRLHRRRGGDGERGAAGRGDHAGHAGVGEDDVEHAAQGHGELHS